MGPHRRLTLASGRPRIGPATTRQRRRPSPGRSPIARNKPFTVVTNAGRALYNGLPARNDLLVALAWPLAIVVVFATLSIRTYRSATSG